MESRFKRWTDGATGQVVMGIENIKQEDEGAYKCVLNGEIEHEFSVYVTGTDFHVVYSLQILALIKSCTIMLLMTNRNIFLIL